MAIPKTAYAKLAAELAPIDRHDAEQAIELGFYKKAAELGLDEHQFKVAYETTVRALAAAK